LYVDLDEAAYIELGLFEPRLFDITRATTIFVSKIIVNRI